MHRLWYDLRSQSLFEPAFRDDVAQIDASLEHMIWRVVSRLAELGGQPPRVPSDVAYAMLDGLFQQALGRHLAGDGKAAAQLKAAVSLVVPQMAAGPAATPAPSRRRKLQK
jgi:hypothetical protein